MSSHLENETLIEFKNIKKSFGSCVANRNINFKVKKGSIHGIIGENGAGKSTAMKILYGLHLADEGEILYRGQSLLLKSPRSAMAHGIGMVHQHFVLAEPETVLDNIILGLDTSVLGILPRPQHLQKLREVSASFGLDVNPEALIEDLSVGEQQRVEILKLLYRNCDVLILDEPTAVLTPQEIESFFSQLRLLKAQGKTILLISHKLKEILSVTDQVTVFRAGQVVANRKTADTNATELAQDMIGRLLVSNQNFARTKSDDKNPVLNVKGLSLDRKEGALSNLSLHVNKSEILGIAGVEGNGQSQLLEALCFYSHLRHQLRGQIQLLNEDAFTNGRVNADFPEFRKKGVGLLPENRLEQAVLLDSSLSENLSLGHQSLPEFSRGFWIRKNNRNQICKDLLEKFDVRPRNVHSVVRNLSGGNQQKFVVGRELRCEPQLLIAAHPTRGVDVGAIEFIHQQLLQARNKGCGILLVSSELEELMTLSDRIVVFLRGRIVAEFSRAEFLDSAAEKKIGLAMNGGAS